MPKTKIYIRADGNSHIGHGHIVRCLSLAQMLKKKFSPVFITQDPSEALKKQILKICPELIVLPRENNYLLEAGALSQKFTAGDFVVLDGYHFNARYREILLHNKPKLVLIDDLHQGFLHADAIINQGLSACAAQYSFAPGTKLCLGPRYALLREPFRKAAKAKGASSAFGSVFINFGGADPKNLTLQVLLHCEKMPQIKNISIVIGGDYRYEADLKKAIAGCAPGKNIELFQNLDAEVLLKLMRRSALAVCSASGVASEYACVGGLLFLIPAARNQEPVYDAFIKFRLAFPFNELSSIAGRKDIKTLFSGAVAAQRKIFNGRSEEKINALFKSLQWEGKAALRKARPDDLKRYFVWANDAEVRANSIYGQPISLATHGAWFTERLANPQAFLYVLELGRAALGQARFEVKHGQALIDYSIDRKFRGKGLGEVILRKGIRTFLAEAQGVSALVGKVKVGNEGSAKIFSNLGFDRAKPEIINNAALDVFRLALKDVVISQH